MKYHNLLTTIILIMMLLNQTLSAAEEKIDSEKLRTTKESVEIYRVDDYVIKDGQLTCDITIDENNKVIIYEAAQILRNNEILLSILFSFKSNKKEFKDEYLNHKMKEAFFALSTRGYYLMADSAFDKMSVGILEPNHLYRAYFLFKNIALPENILALSCIR